ncbi:sulfate permease [Lophiotrema nucula]|uniref:Sulfate permease n=1 Tax=Lophiotrema nucula TaxID=690887 RepID=A0A6A5YT55_9PLEO|nr:sulfate permease [Lophiotrema nucula]
MNYARRFKSGLAADYTLQRTKRYASQGARALPQGTVNYLLEKVPIVHWLPRYNPRWVLNDVLAGVTVGVLLIPQSLAYAKIATIDGQYGLMSSWLPNFLYFFMGTSKDLSTGPTSLMGLLTAEIIRDVSKDGFTPQAIASAVAMSVGIYALAVGLFKLGFLLNFISLPVLNGFISAAAIVIMLGQIPSLFGVTVGTGTGTIIHDLFAQIPDFDGPTVGVGLSGILLLVLMQKMGQRWGKKSKVVWIIALARSFIVLVIYTGLSYGLNKDVDLDNDDPIFAISKVKSTGIAAPKMPEGTLISKVFARSVAPFIAAALEHLAIAKGFGRKNGYTIDQSQELVYLGTTNFFNSFFSSMAVGGAMSRTAVNSDTGVKSPTYGLVAGGFVILAIYELSGALFWIPKATLAAIIVVAVWHIIVPPKEFYKYWKTSFVDFVASMLSFWLTLFVSSEVGIGSAVGFNIAHYLLTLAFTRITRTTNVEHRPASVPRTAPQITSMVMNDEVAYTIPLDAQLFKFSRDIIFMNAYNFKGQCLDAVQTFNSGTAAPLSRLDPNRTWSVAGERRLRQLRARAGVHEEPALIQTVVLDMSTVQRIDTTGIQALRDLQADLRKFGGDNVELRFVDMRDNVAGQFRRYGWPLYQVGSEEGDIDNASPIYSDVRVAVRDRRNTITTLGSPIEKSSVELKEKV